LIESEISPERIKKKIGGFFNFFRSLDDKKRDVEQEVEGELREIFNGIKNHAKQAVADIIEKGLSDVEKIIDEEIKKLENAYNRAKSELENRGKLVAQLKKEIEEKENKLKEIELLKKEVLS
jgi:archaellum component FlaC